MSSEAHAHFAAPDCSQLLGAPPPHQRVACAELSKICVALLLAVLF
jgi:hypothetical protein